MIKKLFILIFSLFLIPNLLFAQEQMTGFKEEDLPKLNAELRNLGLEAQIDKEGRLDVHSKKVTNVATPTATTDGVNKGYVDSAVSTMGQTAGGDLAGTYPNPTVKAGVAWRHSGASVFSGTSPTSWTDLDLSAVVGANYAFVLLKVITASRHFVVCRPNGDSTEYLKAGDADDYAANGGRINDACAMLIACETDSAGVIEWISQGGTVQVIVLGYIK